MTGFGAAEGRLPGGMVRAELRSVNHRYLTISLKMPAEFAGLEPEIRDRLRQDFERGHLTLSLRWLEPQATRTAPVVRLDVERAREAMARLRELQTAVGLNGDITLDLVARQPDVFMTVEPEAAPVDWGPLEAVIARAAGDCRAMRTREGQVLGAELRGRLERIRRGRSEVAALAPLRLVRERERLRGRVSEILAGQAVDESRLAQEIALLADRFDIAEELVRLEAHLDACLAALASDRAMGKHLGFLAQELGREINTIGAKANDAAMQHLVVDMKGELERFREQLENLE